MGVHSAVTMAVAVTVVLSTVRFSASVATPLVPTNSSGQTRFHDKEERGPVPQTLEDMIKSGLAPGEVFTQMELPEEAKLFLHSPLFTTWSEYLKHYKRLNPKEETNLIAALLTWRGFDGVADIIQEGLKHRDPSMIKLADLVQRDNHGLANFIQEALKHRDSSIKKFAEMVQRELMYYWLAMGQTPDDVLKLSERKTKFLTSPFFSTWIHYFDTYKKVHGQGVSLYATLMKHYRDEKTLLAAIFEESHKTKRVRSEVFDHWLSHKKPPDEALTLLGLDQVDDELDDLVEDSRFAFWRTYTKKYALKYPEEKVNAISILSTHYSVSDFVDMIFDYREAPVAKKFREQLFKYWFTTYGESKSMAAIFHSLRLGVDVDILFYQPFFYIWADYVVFYAKLKPRDNIGVEAVLAKLIGEEGIEKAREAVKEENDLETLRIADETLGRIPKDEGKKRKRPLDADEESDERPRKRRRIHSTKMAP
ncbi:hypothetical protein PsorP6_015432 [Peronosclerospora sorghi]|uniref:Uncharacterized protein n=1 Tax=Peronosclerospora sorghi TaxID=230839 RepID=A0ACC0WP77_9STRA|nr:hypothetical protein PsorP6_015432 [Peronosclerospora sorghi]